MWGFAAFCVNNYLGFWTADGTEETKLKTTWSHRPYLHSFSVLSPFSACRYYLKEREGPTAHLHRNAIRLVRAPFKHVQCFYTSVFLAFTMWPFGVPRSVCLTIMDCGHGYQDGETFLSECATQEYLHPSVVGTKRGRSNIITNFSFKSFWT